MIHNQRHQTIGLTFFHSIVSSSAIVGASTCCTPDFDDHSSAFCTRYTESDSDRPEQEDGERGEEGEEDDDDDDEVAGREHPHLVKKKKKKHRLAIAHCGC